METVLFIGIQATGKSTFYRECFFSTHVRINLDMLTTRHREDLLVNACIDAKQPFVVDNTNATQTERAKYIAAAKGAQFRVVGYYFESKIRDAMSRNQARNPEHRVPEKGVLGTYGRLQTPQMCEGFDALFYVRIAKEGGFVIEEWRNEI